jgi:metal-sulfur cluster biosynthetic enzyme
VDRRGVNGDAALDDAVRAALASVHDPCSVAAGRPLSLIDMGLLVGWSLGEDRTLRATFAVTFPGCTLAPHFLEAARAELERIPGVARVAVAVDAAFAWTPERIATAAPAMVGRPQAWRARGARG